VKKIAKYLGLFLVLAMLILATAFLFRTDPIAVIPGKRLSGEETNYPVDWAFSNAHMTIAVESRPDDPHSVTTLCCVHEGNLYVPAQSGSTKKWTHYVSDNPLVRIKIGEDIYPVRATRVLDIGMEDVAASVAHKYSQFADRDPDEGPKDVWLFLISRR